MWDKPLSWEHERPVPNYLWEVEPVQPPDLSYSRPRDRVLHFGGWWLLRHLPLWKENCELIGLTAFCCGGGIRGFEAHFRPNGTNSRTIIEHAGRRDGCPMHVTLQKDEVVTHVYLTRGPPSLIVKALGGGHVLTTS